MRPLTWFMVLALAVALPGAAWAGTIEVDPSVQTAVGVQNAQQVQLGFGVREQTGTIVQQQPQYQFTSRPRRGPTRYNYPGSDDIRVAPGVQTAVGVQNAQQVQLGLPGFGRYRDRN
ncbi:RIP homotypic interaction motif-containing protein [Gloeobacter violaceus]|uniref:Glr1591 protein n=1 Tax=Gloeobacter violaceus (strain ATCC 29082 / PCC 7421) TaxID=251221 RepID=Q7NK87_GLOVI|nr:RIP homotypic interaction motif-containing protein [Gloeobacter violaceus]BAC89532.1 glr1591 [Gloeobacter violaceus PCC 7421]